MRAELYWRGLMFKIHYVLAEGRESPLSAITQVDTIQEAYSVAKKKFALLLDVKWVTTVMDGWNSYIVFIEHTYKGRFTIEQIKDGG